MRPYLTFNIITFELVACSRGGRLLIRPTSNQWWAWSHKLVKLTFLFSFVPCGQTQHLLSDQA